MTRSVFMDVYIQIKRMKQFHYLHMTNRWTGQMCSESTNNHFSSIGVDNLLIMFEKPVFIGWLRWAQLRLKSYLLYFLRRFYRKKKEFRMAAARPWFPLIRLFFFIVAFLSLISVLFFFSYQNLFKPIKYDRNTERSVYHWISPFESHKNSDFFVSIYVVVHFPFLLPSRNGCTVCCASCAVQCTLVHAQQQRITTRINCRLCFICIANLTKDNDD